MFNVRALNHGSFQAVVTAMSYESSLDELDEIEQQLRELLGESRCTCVLWDLLCPNGLEWNRFLSAQFDGCHFDMSSFKVLPISEIDKTIIQEQKIFFQENKVLEKSILSKEQIKSVLA